ncbi:MAG: hypothetical protein CMF59_13960 [Leptospiraceae bacterium]|nr:hypothetical protein [Leptospiraceae bacterium]
MEYQVESGYLLFFQAPLAWWAWVLILSLPGLITGGALYYTFAKSESNDERAFYLGFVLFSLPFFLIPFVFQSLYEGLRIEFHASDRQIVVSDNTGNQYVAPFQDFKAYAVHTSSETDDDGRTKYTYELELVRNTGATIHLFETGSAEKMQELIELARSYLDRPLAGSLERQIDLSRSLRPVAPGLPSEEECLSDFAMIKGEVTANGGCTLRWKTRAHPAFWPVLLLPIVASYFGILLWKVRGFSYKWLLILGISLLVFLGIGYGAMRSFQSVSVLEFRPQGPGMRSYVESPYFGRFDENEMQLSEVAFVDASLGQSTALILYDRNPLSGGIMGAVGAVMIMKSLMIYTDGLPATDKLKLADLVASAPSW